MAAGPTAVAIVALALYGWLALGYATATPLWQNPDEPAHFNYVADVARTGELPVLQPGDYDAALLQRLKTGQLGPGDSVGAIRYESWQPPLYYLVAAQAYRLAPGGDLAGQVRTLRLFDVGLGAVTVLVGYLCAHAVARQQAPWLAASVPLAMAGVPMFTAVSAAVTDDALANLLAALATLATLRLVASRATPWLALLVGVLLGLAILTKLLLAVFAPIALAALLWRGLRSGAGTAVLVRDAALMTAAACLVVAPWLVRQGVTYGPTDLLATQRHELVAGDQARFPGWGVDYVAQWLTTTFHSFWAQFGWMAIPAPDRLYVLWGTVTLLGLAGLLVWLVRRCPRVAGPAIAAAAALAAANAAGLVLYNLTYEQAQGRYLFPSLVPLCLLLALGWSALPLPRPLSGAGALGGAAALVALNGYTLLRVVPAGFAG